MFRASRLLLAATALAVALTASGCTAPAPEPTPTGFASEEEAFAAAEATYRAYIDASNRVDLANPVTFEDVFGYTSGELNASDRESLSRMHADEWSVGGATQITKLEQGIASLDASPAVVTLLVCVDLTTITLVSETGESQISQDRAPIQAREVKLEGANAQDLRVIALYSRNGEPSC